MERNPITVNALGRKFNVPLLIRLKLEEAKRDNKKFQQNLKDFLKFGVIQT